MRVLIVHNRYRSSAPSGENRVVDQESAALENRGHDVELFERSSDEIEEWSSLAKATLPVRIVWNPATHDALSRTLERVSPDVVHIHNTFPILSPSILYACRNARVPVVATLHNYKLLCASGDFFRRGHVCHDCATGSTAPALLHRCYRGSAAATLPPVLAARVHRKAWLELVSAYIFISAAMRRLLSPLGFDPGRAFVKHNLVPGLGVPASARATPKRQVAYIGRLDAAKGVPLLVDAWDGYRADAGDQALRLVIAGDGPLRHDLEQWAASRPSVRLAGHLSRPECADLMSESRAVILPSLWEETFGLVVVEAMALGVPSIASNHGSFPELVADGADGVLFRPGDPGDLARMITDVDLDQQRFASYGRNARATYERRHDPERNIDALLDIYRFALRKPAYP